MCDIQFHTFTAAFKHSKIRMNAFTIFKWITSKNTNTKPTNKEFMEFNLICATALLCFNFYQKWKKNYEFLLIFQRFHLVDFWICQPLWCSRSRFFSLDFLVIVLLLYLACECECNRAPMQWNAYICLHAVLYFTDTHIYLHIYFDTEWRCYWCTRVQIYSTTVQVLVFCQF